MKNRLLNTKNIALIGMLGALSALLMLIEVPLTFLAPGFYKLDLSELPAIIGSFALGPVAGALIELVKILLKLLIKPTTTGFVGELANFCIGCCFVVPAGLLYSRHKTKKVAAWALVLGSLCMTAVGVLLNVWLMLPFYSRLMPLESILAMGAKIWPAVDSVWDFALLCVAPFNLFKAVLVSLLTMLLYKRVSRLIRSFQGR